MWIGFNNIEGKGSSVNVNDELAFTPFGVKISIWNHKKSYYKEIEYEDLKL